MPNHHTFLTKRKFPQLYKQAVQAVLLSSAITLVGCGGSSSSDDGAADFDITSGSFEGDSSTNSVSGSAVDGPVRDAQVTVYVLDTSNPSLKGRPVASGTTGEKGEIVDVSISDADMAEGKFIVETVGGIDLTTGEEPVVSVMRTYVTARNINLVPIDIFATPLSTMALTVAYEKLAADPENLTWESALFQAQQDVRNVYGLGLLDSKVDDASEPLDLFTTPPIASDSANVEDSLNYRVALETFTAIVEQIKKDSGINAATFSTDDVVNGLAADLADGVIDGFAGDESVEVFETVSQDIQVLATNIPDYIAGTEIPLANIVEVFSEEAADIAPEVTVPENLELPEQEDIIAGVDSDGNGEIDALESCLGKFVVSGQGTLRGVESSVADTDMFVTGNATLSPAGNIFFAQELLNIASIGEGTIFSETSFALETGIGTSIILGCNGATLICDGINANVGTDASIDDFEEDIEITRGTVIDDDGNIIEDAISFISWDATTEQQIAVTEDDIFDAVSNTSYLLTTTCETVDPTDTDEDGTPDYLDRFPEDPAAALDSDLDGVPDQWNDQRSADDSTTGLTYLDKFPNDPAASVDDDDDGFPDEWNPNRGAENSTSVPPLVLDQVPGNGDETTDTDGDGTGDNSDKFVNDPAAAVDTDNDGAPDYWNDNKSEADSTSDPALYLDKFDNDPAASVDDDNDGFPDSWNGLLSEIDSTTGLVLDEFPGDSNEWEDTDEDTYGDNLADACVGVGLGYLDTDEDGVCEDSNASPLDACIGIGLGSINTDSDDVCNDLDIDKPDVRPNDGTIWSVCQLDADDRTAEEDILVVTACTNSDGDSHVDDLDNCPNDPSEENINTDRFFTANSSKGWVDGDGICDENEATLGDNDSDADGITDDIDTGTRHGITFSTIAQNEYLFKYSMLSSAVRTGSVSSLTGLSSGSADALGDDDSELVATFNAATSVLTWSDSSSTILGSYTLTGTGGLTAQPGTPTYINSVYSYSGSADYDRDAQELDITMVHNIVAGSAGTADVDYALDFSTDTEVDFGLGNQTVTGCTLVSGFVDLCAANFNDVIGDVTAYDASASLAGNAFTGWTWNQNIIGLVVDAGIADSISEFTMAPIAAFNLWSERVVDASNSGSIVGTATLTNCEQLAGERLCEHLGFDHDESSDATDWLSPLTTPAVINLPEAGGTLTGDFSDPETITVNATETHTLGAGTVTTVTTYTFTCVSQVPDNLCPSAQP